MQSKTANAVQDRPAARPVVRMDEPISKCGLCDSALEWPKGCTRDDAGNWSALSSARCDLCSSKVARARSFNALHFRVPERYKGLVVPSTKHMPDIDPVRSYMLTGAPGIGKTYAAYGILQFLSMDPRISLAAYSWPKVLLELRRSYNMRRGDERPGDEIVDALRQAEVALIDDLGAEKFSDANQAWLQELLFVILDDRWAECRQTILTSNLSAEQLEPYLGGRVVSRIVGMCKTLALKGRDWRAGLAMKSE